MDFAQMTTLVVEDRTDPSVRRWPLSAHSDDGVAPLEPVTSYDQALERLSTTGAERLFVPPHVFGDMVRAGVGPDGDGPRV